MLVWLMCAQAKGYVLGKDAVQACLQIVFQLASVNVRDTYPASSHNIQESGDK